MKLNNVLFFLSMKFHFADLLRIDAFFRVARNRMVKASIHREHIFQCGDFVSVCVFVYLASGFMHRLIQWFVIFDHSLLAQYFLSHFFFRFGFENVNICNGLHVRYISQVAMRIAKCRPNKKRCVRQRQRMLNTFFYFVFFFSVKGVIRSASSKRKINEIESNPFNYSD